MPAASSVVVSPASASAPPPAPGATGSSLPSRDELTKAWGDGVLRNLSAKAKAYMQSGRFVGVDADGAVFAMPNQQWLVRSQDARGEAEAALAARFGRPIPLKLVVESIAPPAAADASAEPDDGLDPDDLNHLRDAEVEVISPEQRLMDAFPGAEEVSP